MRDFRRYKKSFGYAFKGLSEIWEREQNIKLMALAGILVALAGIILKLNKYEFSILLLAISQVLFLETFNTALEMYIDRIIHHDDEKIGIIKDIMAGAVFIAAAFAVAVGILILGPHFLELLGVII